MRLKVKVVGVNKLSKNLRKLIHAANPKQREQALLAGLLPIQNDAKSRAPKKTGTYARSIHSEVESNGDTSEGRTGTNDVRAKMREFGTAGLPGGVLKPKNAPYLVFEVDGQVVRAKEVKQEEQPHFRPAYDSQKNKAIREVARVLTNAVKKSV